MKKNSKTKVKKLAIKKEKPMKVNKPMGEVTHFFTNIKVAIIKFKKPIKVGDEIQIKGATTDFKMAIKSMQYEHEPIKIAKKGQEVGIKVAKKVREGDEVYFVNSD